MIDSSPPSGHPFVHRLRLLGNAGSNKVMQGELSRIVRRAFDRETSETLLQRPPTKLGPGALALPFDARLACLVSMYHRTSARALWDLYETTETRLEPLYESIRAAVTADSRGWFYDGASFSVLAFGTESVAAGERQVVGTIKNALLDGARARGISLELDPEHPELSIHVRSRQDSPEDEPVLSISLDLAGRPLHQRGYRTLSGEAPLREDLAAQLVMLARYDARQEFLVDPMAGAGTLLVEASHAGLGRPLWTSGRKPACSSHPLFRKEYGKWGAPLFEGTRPPLFAAESDSEAGLILQRTLETAGISHQVSTHLHDFRSWEPRDILGAAQARGYSSGLILSNPPYGARLEMSERELFELYRDLGRWCRQFRGQRAAFVIGEPPQEGTLPRAHLFQKAWGERARVTKPLRNGPLRAHFLLFYC